MKLKCTLFLLLMQVSLFNISNAQNINTIIGGLGDNGAATAAELYNPNSIAVDKSGNIYIADAGNNLVRKVDVSGIITTYAGLVGNNGHSGDGGLAVSAPIGVPSGVAVDTSGNLFISDNSNHLVRKVNASGIITTYAGGGGSTSDGISATTASIYPNGIAFDKTGDLYIADNRYHKIRKVNTSGIITTIAGNGTAGFSKDGFAATTAQLNQPVGVCVDKAGNVFIADEMNYRVRKVDMAGIITTYAGNGIVGYAGDGLPATAANLNLIMCVTTDTAGNVFIADNNNNDIRVVNTSGIINRVAGILTGGGFSGDGGLATLAQLNNPRGITTDANGNFYIADYSNNRIRKVNIAGIISTITGCNFHSTQGYKGDGGPAVSALLYNPAGLAYDSSLNFFIADQGNHCVRKVNVAGIISTFAGNDTSGFKGDSALAIHANLSNPSSMTIDKKGNVYICDVSNRRIRKVNSAGIITTYAGNGNYVYSGDGHRADSAGFVAPYSIAIDKYGNIYISDNSDYRIRKIDTNQIITTIAGTGVAGYYGDGGPASAAQIQQSGICSDTSGNIFIADINNYRIRKIDLSGNITTIVGNGTGIVSGDGGLAIFAGIGPPQTVAIDKYGNLFFSSVNTIRKVNTAGIISTYAGIGSSAFSGDGGPAIIAQMNSPKGLILDTAGNLLLADYSNNRIREIYNASISVSTLHDTICAGAGATFTATVSTAPEYTPYFHWLKNGADTGTNSNTYTSPLLKNGDVIACYITNGPTGPAIATSNNDTIYVPSGVPSFGIMTGIGTSVCLGSTVTFSPYSIVDGGLSPVLNWYKNKVLAYTGSNYSFIPSTGDSVFCILTSSLPCLTIDTAVSITFGLTTYIYTPLVNITASPSGTLCVGTLATMSPHPTYGGSSPVYDWYKNGSYVFTGNTYNDTPVNGDLVSCILISDQSCVTTDTANSNTIAFTVTAPADPTISVSASTGDTICPGSSVTCTATATLAGTDPDYAWYKNGALVDDGIKYTLTPLNGDTVTCRLTSNATTCLLTDTATSSIIFSYLTPLPDSVSISVSPGDTICAGTSVTCSPISLNGGTSPVYDWYENNIKEFTGNNFTLSPFNNGDVIYCKLTSSLCTSPTPAISNKISFSITPSVIPSVNVSVDPGTILCSGIPVNCTANVENGGTAPVYTWYQNGNSVFTGSQYSFTPASGDELYCQLTSNATCALPQTVTSATHVFNIDSLPDISITCTPGQVNFRGTTITFNANVSGNFNSYQFQWVKNNAPIPGATTDTYVSSDFSIWDSVYCAMTVTGACSGTITSNKLAIDTYHGMKLYPDPNDGNFVISGNNYDANGDPVNIRIYSPDGKLVYEQNAAFNAITFYTEINLGHQIPTGVYTLRLSYSLENLSFLFVVKH